MSPIDVYKYRRKEWLYYREKVFKRRGFRCERCPNTKNLHVHHPEYGERQDPWEYHVDFCELLCRGCHAREHGKIPPDSGWTLLYSDLEENCPSDPVPCSACRRDVTWHFTVYHPDWGECIVGSGCAERMSLSAEAHYLQRYQRRLDTFLHSPRWKRIGRDKVIKQDGHLCRVRRENGSIMVEVGDKKGEETYCDVDTAKERIFRVLEYRRLKTARLQGEEVHLPGS